MTVGWEYRAPCYPIISLETVLWLRRKFVGRKTRCNLLCLLSALMAEYYNNNNNNIYLLQLGCYPVAVVILHVNKHEIGYY